MTTPFRGERGRFEHSYAAIEAVEDDNCVHRCRRGATHPAERAEYGPGGTCDVLARLSIGEPTSFPTPELREHDDGHITCLAFEPVPPRPPRPHRGPRPIPGQTTLPIPS